MPSRSPRAARPGIALLGLVLGLALAPAPARAGCGAQHDRPAVAPERLAALASGSVVPLPIATPRPDVPPAPPPCKGGLCGPASPLPAPPPAPAPGFGKEWLAPVPSDPPPPTASGRLVLATTPAPPDRWIMPPERPPRRPAA